MAELTLQASEPGRDPGRSRLLAAAGAEADHARHGYAGCEHLLLALLTDQGLLTPGSAGDPGGGSQER